MRFAAFLLVFKLISVSANDQLEGQFDCTLQGMTSPTQCGSAKDDLSQPCVWCSQGPDFGVCLSQEQSDIFQQLMPDVECGGGEEVVSTTQDIYDPACLEASMVDPDNSEGVCAETTDEDGNPCVWCDAAGVFGLCVNSEQADAAGAYLQCGDDSDSSVGAPPIPPDIPECLVHSSENECNSAEDPSCVWCNTAAGVGLCLSQDAAAIAEGYAPLFQCDADQSAPSAQSQAEVEDPLDPTCVTSALNAQPDAAKGICQGTQDMDGDTCVWCSFADVYGLCLTPDQSQMAGGYLTCEEQGQLNQEPEKELPVKPEDPYDVACFLAAYSAADAETACDSATDSGGDACVWCEAPTGNQGACLDHDQAEMAAQFLSCNMMAPEEGEDINEGEEENVAAEEVKDPYDVACFLAAYSAPDAEAACSTATDSSGDACVWCEAPTGDGTCLDRDQAEMAAQVLSCDLGATTAAVAVE